MDVIQENTTCIGFDNDCQDIESNKSIQEEDNKFDENDFDSGDDSDDMNQTIAKQKASTSTSRRSTRPRKPKHDDQYVYNTIYVNYCNAIVPDTYEKAISSTDCKH